MPRLQEIVDSLPQDLQELHDLLVANRCIGEVQSARKCPIAMYLTKKSGQNTVVSTAIALLDIDRNEWVDTTNEAHLPEHVQTFIHNFDLGKYPDLVRVDDYE